MFQKRKPNNKFLKTKIQERKPKDQWSNLQNDIFKHVADGKDNAVVFASPGSGKTTTIEESLFHVPKNEQSVYLAFNKSIADEFMLRVPLGATSRTFHKLGAETVRKEWGSVYNLRGPSSIDKDDLALINLLSGMVSKTPEAQKLIESLVWAVKMSKTMLASTHEEIERVCCDFGIPTHGINNKDFTGLIIKVLELSKDKPLKIGGNNVISFDDMLWLPHVKSWDPVKFDRVFVDEAQDLSASRMSLALKAMKDDAKICAFGDPYQCIFTFAGANSAIIDSIIQSGAKKLPLSISYRCPKKVVELAQAINPDITSGDNAIDGVINHETMANLHSKLVPGKSAILSRNNFSLIKTAFHLIQHGIKASIIGKDIGNRFIWRINNWNPDSVTDLKRCVQMWRDEAIENSPSTAKYVTDEANSILKFTEHMDTVSGVRELIKKFFSENNDDQVKLSTTHKAKGLEWEHVFLLEKTFKPGKSTEENNILYVAITRAKQSLTFVD